MISWSTLFHPLALDLLVIPFAIVLGILASLFFKKVIVGVLITVLNLIVFDVWFWGYFYEAGQYGVNVSFDDFIFYTVFAGITFLISKSLLNKNNQEHKPL
ncbi:hypothetical protein IMZ31_04960 [Pontibacillus sp. ALD_SL1]|uniref:hypothetical protein n=1 Tax=Pontibacillus sp. ALD_SL1 TaxID=2777185 RepID=UPI001A96E89D|nr:hypothetical protein [Pontibacillus sp. ALD_SL1]QST00923.1 hypothetical protein IMZ31_04960 [Pontibacillus sp. ALD_SL1]